jgi:hypothetical protein
MSDKVTIENRTSNDYFFPRYETEMKELQNKTLVTNEAGDKMVVEETVDHEVKTARGREHFHLPPTLDDRDPGQVQVDREVIEQMKESPAVNLQAMVDAGWIRVGSLDVSDV